MLRAPAASAFIVSGLIALSACSSGHSVPAVRATVKVSTARPQPSASPVIVPINSEYSEVFSTPLPADPEQAAVISGFRESQILWDQSTVALRLTGPTTEYVTGEALTRLRKVIQTFASGNLTPVGMDRLYDTKVTSLAAGSAVVTTCDDGTAYNVADRASGATEPPAPTSQDFDFAEFGMRLVAGRWAASSVTVILYPDQRVKACMQIP